LTAAASSRADIRRTRSASFSELSLSRM
jgi:hypothetical protein